MRILVAEDNPEWREQVAMYLEADGYEVLEADNGLEAYRLYLVKRPDAVILDVEMPGTDGLSLTRQILAHDPSMPVIIMSGHTTGEDVSKGYALRVKQYFEKPFDISKMIAYLRSLDIQPVLHFGNCTYTPATHVLTVNGQPTVLASSLGKILHCLVLHIGQPVSRKELAKATMGHDRTESRTIDVHISRLRKVLAADTSVTIESHYGGGYRLIMVNNANQGLKKQLDASASLDMTGDPRE